MSTTSSKRSLIGGIVHGLLPAFLMAVSVGQIYAFTNYSNDIAAALKVPQSSVQWAFSLGIFFLGMGAAFFGKIVEGRVTRASIIGMILFLYGLCGTAFSIEYGSLPGVIISYGVFLGLGTGIIYISPVKTMMMWFQNKKALAAAVPIVSFGLGSSLSVWIWSTPFMQRSGIVEKFLLIAGFYFILMTISIFLLKKPELDSEGVSQQYHEQKDFSYFKLLKDPWFIGCWLFMLLNISAGLSLIPLSKQIMSEHAFYTEATIGVILTLAGLFNGGGRLLFAAVADSLQVRHRIMVCISLMSLAAIACLFWSPAAGMVILAINMLYGAGFSVIPAILSDHYGMSNISKIHGAVLSAWGVAGLMGNQIALKAEAKWGFTGVIIMLLVAHLLNATNYFGLVGARRYQPVPVSNFNFSVNKSTKN